VGGRSARSEGIGQLSLPASFLAVVAALLAQDAQPEADSSRPSGSPLVRQAPPVEQLPEPTADPLAINPADDPILRLSRESVASPEFLRLVQQAVDRSPRVGESRAGIAEAEAAEDEARAGMFPSIDTTLNSQRSIVRNFEDRGINNIVERSRAEGRSDLTISVNQPVYDFGATEARIAAAGARLRAAAEEAEASADQVALRAIAAWYDVFAYRALVTLGTAFSAGQTDLREAIQTRISQGVSAPGDLPRVESYIASAEADLARYRRQLANAEARFEEMFGQPAPANIGRAPIVAGPTMTKEMAQFLARSNPEVEGADALARAARQEAKAARAQTLPSLSAGIDAGKYGLVDSDDYDVRGRLTVRHRLFGGVDARADQARARATAADARASRIRSEAEREAAIAWSDVVALEQQLAALQSSYIASRQSRDVLAERFRVARGTLFDLLESESGYFNVSATYIRAITELDASRYVLLSRTGRLLPTLDIEPPALEER
jgi:outer membrane protein, adhesin transport system